MALTGIVKLASDGIPFEGDDLVGPVATDAALAAAAARPAIVLMAELADRLEAAGNTAGAEDVRADITRLTAARPTVFPLCDGCGRRVTAAASLERYDALGVDWVLCALCEREQ